LRRSFRASLQMSTPSRILDAMSDALMEQAGLVPPSPTFAAVLVATIDLECGVLSYAAAGVEGGLVFGDPSPHVHLGATGPLLGLVRNPRFEERAMRFLPGDTLVAYTDGVTEAPAATPDAYLGSSGLIRSMRRIQQTGQLTIRALWKEIGQFTGHVYHDDATLAIVTTPKASVRAAGSRLRVYEGGLAR
jgi:serine phosphatase RsbU (regulator of sigma subunit)